MNRSAHATVVAVDPTLVSELQAGHELLGELLGKMLEAQRAPAQAAPPVATAEGSGVRAAAPRVARGTEPPPGRRADLSDPRLKGVTELKRDFNGWHIVVHVMPDGFEWGGKVWSSLSAIAKAVTGSNRNGYEFFNLVRR